MTEKRGTGTEYGQEKLKDRAVNYDSAVDEKKPNSKLKLIGVLIIAIIGVGALYPVVFGGNKTPAERTEEVVALNSDGITVEDKETTTQPAIANADANKAAADISVNSSGVNNAEQRLLDNAAPATPSTEIVPAEKVKQHATGQLHPEDVKGITGTVIHDPTVKATDEAKMVSQTGTKIEQFDAAKFGIGTNTVSTAVQQSRPDQHLQPVQQVLDNSEPSSDLNSDDMLKNYTGQSSEATYQVQSQNTVYVYGSFAAKVYLLPIGKNEKINAYLSDGKGWEVSQLPGDILRIKRSANKSDWSDATDLFLIAGKRTYTLILQAVDQPKLRTDSLRYIEPKSLPVANSGKK